VWVFWPGSGQLGQERICVAVGRFEKRAVGIFKRVNTVEHNLGRIGKHADMDCCCWPLNKLPVFLFFVSLIICIRLFTSFLSSVPVLMFFLGSWQGSYLLETQGSGLLFEST